MFFLRKLIRRVRSIARMQFTGGTRIIETMQEALQGMRIVKAFTLEDEMRRRLDDERRRGRARVQQDGARRQPRQPADGDARRLRRSRWPSIYGGYRVIETGATPGEFVSFLAAFLLAYEPAKRLARLNIDLNNSLVGVRVLFEMIDSPPTEPDDDDKPPLQARRRRASNSPMCASPTAPASRCCAACRSSPSPARSRRWSGPRAAASRRSST